MRGICRVGSIARRRAGHEVLIGLPMEPADYPRRDPGPQTLLTSLDAAENLKRLRLGDEPRPPAMSGSSASWATASPRRERASSRCSTRQGARPALRRRRMSQRQRQRRAGAARSAWPGRSPTAPSTARPTGAAIDAALAELESVAAKDGAALGIGVLYPGDARARRSPGRRRSPARAWRSRPHRGRRARQRQRQANAMSELHLSPRRRHHAAQRAKPRLRRPPHRHAGRLADAARRHRRGRDAARRRRCASSRRRPAPTRREHPRRKPPMAALRSAGRRCSGKVWGGRYRGQEQKWFAMRFTGGDADFDLATPHPEFDAWRWVAPAELPGAHRALQAHALRGRADGVPRRSSGCSA